MNRETTYNFIIDEDNQSTRIDSVLSLLLPDTSRSFIQKLIEGGNLTVNGKSCTKKKYLTTAGDRVELRVPEPEQLKIEAENIPLEIVFEDEDVLVVNKPKGMVVHPAVGNYTGTLVNAVMYHCGDRLSSINGVVRPGIVHRIDKDTSGLLMIAKNDMAHESLSAQLAAHSITRRYTALVYDNLVQDEGSIDAPIGRDPTNRLRQAVTTQNSKRAVTHWHVLERFGRYTLIEAETRNRKNASDSRTYGLYQASAGRRSGLRTEKTESHAGGTDAARGRAGLRASTHRRLYGIYRAAACVF